MNAQADLRAASKYRWRNLRTCGGYRRPKEIHNITLFSSYVLFFLQFIARVLFSFQTIYSSQLLSVSSVFLHGSRGCEKTEAVDSLKYGGAGFSEELPLHPYWFLFVCSLS